MALKLNLGAVKIIPK